MGILGGSMLRKVLLLVLPVLASGGNVAPQLGVPPESRALYAPSSSSPPTWKCLSSNEEILWTEVNDDYCDCSDGSDEPGTSACANTTFYCVNEGHIGAHIPKSRVHDGKCEPECCDGSDEPAGTCSSTCKETGQAYRTKMEAERKVRKTGSKIRATYLVFAQKEKKRLEESVSLLEREVEARRQEVARLKEIFDRTESLSASALEFKKQSPLYQSLLTHHRALKSLRDAYTKHIEREKELGDILEALKGGYNPNYQDMAVLAAVRGWEALSATSGKDEDEEAESTASSEGDDWMEEHLGAELDRLMDQDHVALLLGHDTHITQESSSLLFDISSYLPEAIIPRYNSLWDTAVGWLRTIGIIGGSSALSDETERARTAHISAESKLTAAETQWREDKDELVELFDPQGFGREGEWKKLQGLCLSKDTGEYIYEVCLFGDATQKQGGSSHNLGKFSSWSTEPDVKPGEPRYYQTQHYTRGAKCWNGPERSVTLYLSCGTENVILTIEEPEKCEYHLTATTPALCLPLEAENQRAEL